MIKLILKNLVIVLILSSCAPKISNLPLYQKHHFPRSSFMPSKENLKGAAPKALIFDFDEGDIIVAKQSKLGSSLAVNIANKLTKNRLIEILDRKVARKLEKEIMLSQLSGDDASYDGPKVADYAISGSVGNASFDKKYSAGMTLYSKERGYYKTSPRFKYSANVSGNVKIYEIPSMEVVDNIAFSGYASRNENVQKSGGVSIGGIIELGVNQAKGIDRDDGLVRKAAINAIEYISSDLKNVFAKRGYILEKRVFKNKSIFKISLGSKDGMTHGDRFEVIGQFEIENPITNEIEIEKRILATGRVSNQINPKFSFVVLDKQDYSNMVRLGDVIKFKYKRSFSQKLSKYTKYVQ